MAFSYIKENLAQVRQRIQQAAQRVGRDPRKISLVAVSKTVGMNEILAAYEQEQRVFGENRVPALVEKQESGPADIQWHMIGRLQRNKAAAAVRCATLIHSVDSSRLLNRINRCAEKMGKIQDVLLEINVSGESAKAGLAPEDLPEFLSLLPALPHVHCRGLMTMAPFGADEETLRTVFSGLRRLLSDGRQTVGPGFDQLSMGMSGDFEVAVEEGATIVRVGTAIFRPSSID